MSSMPPISPGGFERFEDFFGPGFFKSPLQIPEHGDIIPWAQLDRFYAFPDPIQNHIYIILRDSTQPRAPGYGVVMTVREATKAVDILRLAIARLELGFFPPEDEQQEGSPE